MGNATPVHRSRCETSGAFPSVNIGTRVPRSRAIAVALIGAFAECRSDVVVRAMCPSSARENGARKTLSLRARPLNGPGRANDWA